MARPSNTSIHDLLSSERCIGAVLRLVRATKIGMIKAGVLDRGMMYLVILSFSLHVVGDGSS